MKCTNMGDKRPYDCAVDVEFDTTASPAAKRVKLNDLKSQMETLMKAASERHEDIRIAAVDKAYGLEVKLRETQTKHEATRKELEEVTDNFNDASASLKTFQGSDTMKMLKAANVCTLEDVEPLSQEYRAINDVLNQLVAMEKSLSQRRDVLQQCTDDLSSEISDLQTKYETAESRVNVITELNE